MQFLKILFWVMVAVVGTIFSIKNWNPPVALNLWGDLQVLIRLPLLVLIAFAAGALPFYLLHATTRWRLRRRIDSHERSLAELRPPVVAPAEPLAPAVEPVAQS